MTLEDQKALLGIVADVVGEELEDVKKSIPTQFNDEEIKKEIEEVKNSIPTIPEIPEAYNDEEIKAKLEEIKNSIPEIPEAYNDEEIKAKLEEVEAKIPTIPEGYDDTEIKASIAIATKSLDFWKEGVTREGVSVKHNNGEIYRATEDTATEPSPYSKSWEMVQRGTRFEGTFDKEKTYAVGAMYIKNYSTFLVTDEKHVLMAARGSIGKTISIDEILKALDLSSIVKTIELNVKSEYEMKFKALEKDLETYKKSFKVEQPKPQNFVTMEYLNEMLEEFSHANDN